MPSPIPDTPEHIMRRVVVTPNNQDEWDCLRELALAGTGPSPEISGGPVVRIVYGSPRIDRPSLGQWKQHEN
jgi:hypothetical protein